MKITDYMQNAMDILRTEFAFREEFSNDLGVVKARNLNAVWDETKIITGCPHRGGYVWHPIYTLGVTADEFIEMAGAKHHNGVNTQALVFRDGVIKWSSNETMTSHYSTNEDARFYQDIAERFPKYRKYLAETIQFRDFTVQELICPAHEAMRDPDVEITDDERFDLYATVIRVAHALGLRDVHTGNWGFRGDDFSTPVIFDFSERRNPGSAMSWYRLNPQFEWIDRDVGMDYTIHLKQLLSDLNDLSPPSDDPWNE
jgi:hypothetical protein